MAATDAFEGLAELLEGAATEAVIAAEDAAAEVYVKAIRAAAPRKSGQLASSVRVFESVDRKVLAGQNRKRLLAGPDKKKGYYGYFIDKGWKAPLGPRVTYTTMRGDRWNPKGHTYTTGRRRRMTGRAAHSQMGRTGYREIPAKPWFEAAVRGADSAAEQAAETALNAKLEELNGKI